MNGELATAKQGFWSATNHVALGGVLALCVWLVQGQMHNSERVSILEAGQQNTRDELRRMDGKLDRLMERTSQRETK